MKHNNKVPLQNLKVQIQLLEHKHFCCIDFAKLLHFGSNLDLCYSINHLVCMSLSCVRLDKVLIGLVGFL